MTLLGSTEIETNPRYIESWVSEADIKDALCAFPIQSSRAKLVFRQLDITGSQNRSGTRMVV